MKKILYLFIIISLVLVSCKNRKKQKEADKAKSEVVKETPVKPQEKSEYPPEEVVEITDEKLGKTVVISLSKTVCFGACPAFKFSVYGNNKAIYEGIKDVDKIGSYVATIPTSEIEKLLTEAASIGYYSLNDVYDNKYVTDLPTATTYLNFNGKEKKIICRYDCDQKINKINKLIEEMIKNAKWKKVK